MRLKYAGLGLVATAALAAAWTGARAQTVYIAAAAQDFTVTDTYNRGRNVSVTERDRPEYDALGMHAGAFTLFPKLETDAGLLYNVFATHSQPKTDGYFEMDPELNVASNWSRNSLIIDVAGKFQQFTKYSTENQSGGHITADGRLDVYGNSNVGAGFDVQRIYEPRTDAGSPTNAVSPVPIDTAGGYLGGTYQGDRIRVTGKLNERTYTFENVASTVPGASEISGRGRDENDLTGEGRLEYALTPDTAVFGQYSYKDATYPNNAPGQAKRSSTENKIVGGANFDLSALVRGAVGVGYVSRQYTSSTYPGISGPTVGAKIEYFPSEITTVTLTGGRVVQDAILNNSGGYFSNTLGLSVDHEFRANLLANAGVNYENDSYVGISHTDTVLNFSLGARYFVSHTVGLGLTANYGSKQVTGDSAGSFTIASLLFSLILQR